MKGIILTFAFLVGMVATPLFSTAAYAAPNPLNEACRNLSDTQKAQSAACSEDGSKNPISGGTDSILYKITLIISVLAGAIAVIIMIIAGISMITAAGDSQKFGNARSTIVYAVVGLIVIVLAQAIITFVVTRFTNT